MPGLAEVFDYLRVFLFGLVEQVVEVFGVPGLFVWNWRVVLKPATARMGLTAARTRLSAGKVEKHFGAEEALGLEFCEVCGLATCGFTGASFVIIMPFFRLDAGYFCEEAELCGIGGSVRFVD